MLLSEHMTVTLQEIRTSWSFDDLDLANGVLDEIERVQGVAKDRAEKEAAARRRSR